MSCDSLDCLHATIDADVLHSVPIHYYTELCGTGFRLQETVQKPMPSKALSQEQLYDAGYRLYNVKPPAFVRDRVELCTIDSTKGRSSFQ